MANYTRSCPSDEQTLSRGDSKHTDHGDEQNKTEMNTPTKGLAQDKNHSSDKGGNRELLDNTDRSTHS